MKNKQLICCQVKYLNILSDFNFKIIFRTNKINIKVNILIYMFNFFFFFFFFFYKIIDKKI